MKNKTETLRAWWKANLEKERLYDYIFRQSQQKHIIPIDYQSLNVQNISDESSIVAGSSNSARFSLTTIKVSSHPE